MLVYRIEDTYGVGPYTNDDALDLAGDLCSAHCMDSQHPGPYADGMDELEDAHVFGFDSRAQMAAWFDGWAEELEDAGHHVAVYQVPASAVIAGGHQIAFVREYATPVTSYPPTALISSDGRSASAWHVDR